MRMLDLFCGRLGWSKAFAARGWECVGVDLAEPPDAPKSFSFIKGDILEIKQIRGMDFPLDISSPGEPYHYAKTPYPHYLLCQQFDFICASPPCEEFSVHGMKHFHPNPKYPAIGIKLFNHARALCEASGVPYIMENVRFAQGFVGQATMHCGPFYLWGSGVPPLMPQGIKKGFQTGGTIIQKLKRVDRAALTAYRRLNDGSWSSSGSAKRKEWTAKMATIPPELANCVADYAERILVSV